MRTVTDDGRPYDAQELMDSFALRIEALGELAHFAARGAGGNGPAEALELGISHLREDFEVFEGALGAAIDREVEAAAGEKEGAP